MACQATHMRFEELGGGKVGIRLRLKKHNNIPRSCGGWENKTMAKAGFLKLSSASALVKTSRETKLEAKGAEKKDAVT